MTQSNLDKEFKSQEWNETVLKTVDSIVEIANKKVVMPAHRIARFFVYTFVAIVLLVIVFIAQSSHACLGIIFNNRRYICPYRFNILG